MDLRFAGLLYCCSRLQTSSVGDARTHSVPFWVCDVNRFCSRTRSIRHFEPFIAAAAAVEEYDTAASADDDGDVDFGVV